MLHWDQARLKDLLSFALPSSSEEDIVTLMNSKRISKDICAQVYSCQGFRGEPYKAQTRSDGVLYMNVYSTEKTPTYNFRHQGHFRRHRYSDLYPENIAQLESDAEALCRVFRWCMGDRQPIGAAEPLNPAPPPIQHAGARFELRMKFSKAETALREFPPELMAAIICLPARDWWYVMFDQGLD